MSRRTSQAHNAVTLTGAPGPSGEALYHYREYPRLAGEATGIGDFTIHTAEGYVCYSPEIAALLGFPGARAAIEDVFARVHWEDAARVRAAYEAALGGASAGRARADFRFVGLGGAIRWVSCAGRVVFQNTPDGCVPLVIGACVDRTEQIMAERALRASEARFRGIFEHAGTGIAIKDLEGRFQSCNPAYIAMLGYSEEELRAHACADLMHPDDHAYNMLQQKRLIGGDIAAFEHGTRYFNKTGEMLWTHRHVSLLRDGAGRPSNIIVLVTDITQHKRHEERIHLLMQEVNHRSKNMLTVVHAIARQTAATKPDDFVERFGERVRALAASQDLLVKNDWMGVGLGALVRAQLAHFKDLIGSRIELSGPSLVISAAAAQTLGMALHELATNAGKYGALSNRDGQVNVAWRVTPGEPAEQKFTMSWSELGGPRVEPPAREGFGSTVIRRMAMESLNAEVTLDYPAAGFSWRLECPAGEIT